MFVCVYVFIYYPPVAGRVAFNCVCDTSHIFRFDKSQKKKLKKNEKKIKKKFLQAINSVSCDMHKMRILLRQ